MYSFPLYIFTAKTAMALSVRECFIVHGNQTITMFRQLDFFYRKANLMVRAKFIWILNLVNLRRKY